MATTAPASYWERRNTIAALASGPTAEPVEIEYLPEEHATWAAVSAALRPGWEQWAAPEVLEAAERLALPSDRVPQLAEVDAALTELTGFRYRAVAGILPGDEFFRALADRTFPSTQYVRWSGSPLYTPEPDVIHEVIGHGNCLACPHLAELHRLAGASVGSIDDPVMVKAVADVFWFSVEFGVVRAPTADGGWRAYGAGLLSSPGELDWFADHAEIRPLDPIEMATTPFDIDHYQPILFAGDSLDHVLEVVGGFFESAANGEVTAASLGVRSG